MHAKYYPGYKLDQITFVCREPSLRDEDTRWKIQCDCGHQETVYLTQLHKRIRRYGKAMCCACGREAVNIHMRVDWDKVLRENAVYIYRCRHSFNRPNM